MARLASLAAIVVLVACGPSEATSRTTPTASPVAAKVSPSPTFDPLRLAPGDCVAPPPQGGPTAHSGALGLTVTLPAGWTENPADEGSRGMQSAFALESGTAPQDAAIFADPFVVTTMSPREAIAQEITEPGAGTVVVTGECTIAGSAAAYFEFTVQAQLFPGIGLKGGGYGLDIAHGHGLISLTILLPTDYGGGSQPTRADAMTQIKSILGSLRWDEN